MPRNKKEEIMKTKMLKMGYLLITSFICAGFLSSAYAGQTPALPKQASIATHLVGGIFHALGMGVAKVVTNHTPIRVVVKPTSGPFTYMPMLNTGEVEMGLPNSLDTKYAFDGSPILKYERTNNLRMLLPGGPNVGMIPIVARKDSGIKTIADLKGRRVTAGFSGNVVMALQMEGHLALGGLSWDDVVKVPVVDYKTALQAIRDGRAEACFGANYFAAATLELNEAVKLHPIPLDTSNPAYVKRFKELLPGFKIVEVKPTLWLPGPTTVTSYAINLVAYAGFSEDAGYLMVKTLYENYKELNAVGGAAEDWKPEYFCDPEPLIPYHPGTIRYYKEKGLWTPAMEKLQNELLAKAK